MKSAESRWLVVGLAGLLSVSAVTAQAPEPGEEWQMTASMQMGGMSMPGQKTNQCVAVSQKNFAPEPPDPNCTSSVLSQTADTVTMRFSCTGKDAMEGTGTFTHTGKSMKGQVNMKTRDGDEMLMNYSGVNTGKACDAKAMERKVNALVAQGEAQTAQFCTESASKGGQASMLFGKDPVCKDPKYKPMYCANIKDEKGYLMLRSEQTMSRSANTQDLIPEIESACKVSMPAMKQQLCSNAEQRKSWKFMAQECEAEASTLAAAQCAGRSYTVVSQSPYKDFCSAYGMSGGQADAAAQAPPAEEKAQDKIKRGLKGLKGALGL